MYISFIKKKTFPFVYSTSQVSVVSSNLTLKNIQTLFFLNIDFSHEVVIYKKGDNK